MKNIVAYNLFEGLNPTKQTTEIVLSKEENPSVIITVTVDSMNRISDVRSPSGIRHIFQRGNVLNSKSMKNWMESNGFVERNRSNTKRPLKGNELVKFIMKRGY